jgi:hypothetical protein
VDIAYRIEEDTINMADRFLDRYVEQQVREMIMAYPNNQQRRSHTILIDSSNDKLQKKQPVSTPINNISTLKRTTEHDNSSGAMGPLSPLSPTAHNAFTPN